jgi:cell division septal protein FtsQ
LSQRPPLTPEPVQRRLIVPPSPDLALDPVLPAATDGGHLPPPLDDAPFLRPERRTRVRQRRRGWTYRTILALQLGAALLVAVSAVWAGYSRVMASERLKVGKVEVRGGHFLSEGEVRELLGPAVGENILSLDIEGLKSRLRASPWVADATVSRTLPDTLRVEIREREPLALAEMERLYLMDGDGALIDIYGPRTAGFDLPIVRGLAHVDADARRDRAARAGALLRDVAELAGEISEVEVEPSGDLRVVLRGAGEVVLMGAPPYRGRFVTFLGLRQELRERCPRAEYFDLRFRDRIYAKQPLDAAGKTGEAPPSPVSSPDTREMPSGPRIEPIHTVAVPEVPAAAASNGR